MKKNRIGYIILTLILCPVLVGVILKYLPTKEGPESIVTQTAINSPNATQVAGDYIVKNKPRIISEETIRRMQPALKASSVFTAEIKVPLGDSESFEVGEQLKEVLQKAGWKIDKVWPVIADPPIRRGIKLYFGHRPSGAIQAVFAVCW